MKNYTPLRAARVIVDLYRAMSVSTTSMASEKQGIEFQDAVVSLQRWIGVDFDGDQPDVRHPFEPGLAFGLRLKAIRLNAGKSQRDVGHRAGMTQPQYSKYELGSHEPGFPVLRRLVYGLELCPADLHYLVTGEPDHDASPRPTDSPPAGPA